MIWPKWNLKISALLVFLINLPGYLLALIVGVTKFLNFVFRSISTLLVLIFSVIAIIIIAYYLLKNVKVGLIDSLSLGLFIFLGTLILDWIFFILIFRQGYANFLKPAVYGVYLEEILLPVFVGYFLRK